MVKQKLPVCHPKYLNPPIRNIMALSLDFWQQKQDETRDKQNNNNMGRNIKPSIRPSLLAIIVW